MVVCRVLVVVCLVSFVDCCLLCNVCRFVVCRLSFVVGSELYVAFVLMLGSLCMRCCV